ncbi:MAG: lytic transglycosylase domain-containing protein [Burkholderiaceae bacterium]
MLGGLPLAAVSGAAALHPRPARAGAQQYEPLGAAVRSALSAAIADRRPPEPVFASVLEKVDWLATMADRLPRRWAPDHRRRVDLLSTLHYEAKRAGLDPQLVLGLIQVESNFRQYAVSTAGARGLMQVMPFWAGLIGDGDASRLFEMRANLRYGCTILRHYLDIEKGDLFRALGRYNGSLGRPEYPNLVLNAWRRWSYTPPPPSAPSVSPSASPSAPASAASASVPSASSASSASSARPVPSPRAAPTSASSAEPAPTR